MPIVLGSGWPGWVDGPGWGPVSKFLRSWFSQCLVDGSSCKQVVKVLSLSWSGKHCLNAKRALQINNLMYHMLYIYYDCWTYLGLSESLR